MAANINDVKNAIYDCCLTGFGYIPFLLSYDIMGVAHRANKDYVMSTVFNNFKSVQLPDGYSWADFLPSGTPVENWMEWEDETLAFLTDPDGYVDALVDGKDFVSDWSTANDAAQPLLGPWVKDVAIPLDLCPTYDQIWPLIVWNYRSMASIDATVDQRTVNVMATKDTSVPSPYPIIRKRLEREANE